MKKRKKKNIREDWDKTADKLSPKRNVMTIVLKDFKEKRYIVEHFSGSNIDDSFTTAVSNLFFSPEENSDSCRFGII